MPEYFETSEQEKIEQQDSEYCFNCGEKCLSGKNFVQSNSLACVWFMLAADEGHAGSQCNLGYMYQEGRGVPQSDAEAIRWFKLAADQGHAGAQS